MRASPPLIAGTPAARALPLARRLADAQSQADAFAAWRRWAHLPIDSALAGDLQLLAWGAFTPLADPLGRSDYFSVVHSMRLQSGALFPLPIVVPVPPPTRLRLSGGDRLGLRGPAGFRALLDIEEVYERDLEEEARYVYGTTQPEHPGVARLLGQSRWCAGGRLTLLRPMASPFAEPADPLAVRAALAQRGWRTVVAFQTRNPIHRAHEYLHKLVLQWADGLLLHPLVGPTKADDLPATVRMEAYRVVTQAYYPADRVLLATFPFAMRYAGPREAVLHALVRRNYGATHFIVGRDHAGVGKFYHPAAAQELVARLAPELGIVPVPFAAAGYCRHCREIVTDRSCPHPRQAWLQLSGTELRERLRQGLPLPPEVTRPEVAAVLTRYRMERPD